MELLNNNIIVEFDEKHNKVFEVGGIELMRPDTWKFEELNNGSTQYQKNTNLKDTNPQIATVVVPNRKYPLAKGDKIFTHYLAIDNAEPFEVNGKEHQMININSIFFKISTNGELEVMEDVYLGEQVFDEGIKTESGIWLTPYDKKKEVCRIKITHAPKNTKYTFVGDIAVTVDDNQYELDLNGKKYIKLNTWHILGTMN